jgi:hypothetical protein
MQVGYLRHTEMATNNATCTAAVTDKVIVQLVERQCRYKNTSGVVLLERMQAVAGIA